VSAAEERSWKVFHGRGRFEAAPGFGDRNEGTVEARERAFEELTDDVVFPLSVKTDLAMRFYSFTCRNPELRRQAGSISQFTD
jgi:hypothetical protein